jgi:hypothetical protein
VIVVQFRKGNIEIMNGIALAGFGRLAFAAAVGNQIALAISAFCGWEITPLISIVGIAVYAYWDWNYADWTMSLTPGQSNFTREDKKQLYISSFIFAVPLLWLAIPHSLNGIGSEFSFWWAANVVNLAAIVGASLLQLFKHYKI